MIKKLRLKLVALSMAALFALLAGIIAGMNVINYNAVVSEADATLTLLAKNGGAFPDFEGGGGKGGLPPHMSPEAPYETRYFSVLLNENGEVLQTDTGRIKAVDSEMAIAYANLVVSRGTERGFAEHYRFMRTAEGAGVSGVLLSRESVDLYNPKVIRSTMGSIYRMPFFYSQDLREDLKKWKSRGICLYAAHLKGSRPYDEADYRQPAAFLIGNESQGLTEETADLADCRIRIPMEGQV